MTKFEFQTGDKVLARYGDDDKWAFQHFSHMNGVFYYCDGWSYHQCIPYNETTKHLCGTSDPYIDPKAFEVGDTVRFQYTENTTGCGEIVGATGDTFQVSVFGGVYSVDRKRLNLVRKGEKKTDAPDEAPAFEFGDVVEYEWNNIIKTGIFCFYLSREKRFARVACRTREFDSPPTSSLRLIRKGNFND